MNAARKLITFGPALAVCEPARRIVDPTPAEVIALNRRGSKRGNRGRCGARQRLIGPPTFVSSVASLAWWRSDQRVYAPSGTVASWTDILSGYSLAQGTSASQPNYTATDAAMNNKPSLSGDGIQQWLEVTGKLPSLFSGSDVPWSAYIVMRPASVVADGVFMALSSTTVSGSRVHLNHVAAATAWRSARIDDAAASASQSGGTPVVNTNYLVRVHFTGTAITIVANGVTVVNNLALDVGTLTCDRLSIFAQRQGVGAPASLLSGKIGELAIFAGRPTAGEEALMVPYFTGFWGSPVA